MKRRILLALAVVVVVAAPLFSATPALAAQTPGINGNIAFKRSTGGLFTINPNTSTVTQLQDPEPSTEYHNLSYSPDGTKIAFQDGAAPSRAWVANANGSNARELSVGWPISLGWNKDGSRILMTIINGSNREIRVVNPDDSSSTLVTSTTAPIYAAQFSPDGTKIAYANGTSNQIFVMNADGTGATNITASAHPWNSYPSWSPDGTKIIYLWDDGSGTAGAIGTMNPDGTGKATITTTSDVAVGTGRPIYSPDGTKIAWSDETTNRLHIMNADGTGDSVNSTGTFGDLSWQPMTLGPTASTSTPSLTLSDKKATLDIAGMYTDPYGAGINKNGISITGAPAHGTTAIDTSTGKITYTATSVAKAEPSFWDGMSHMFFARASAATPLDSFTYRVCSNSAASLCTTGTASVFAGAPNTGTGVPQNPWTTAGLYVAAAISLLGIFVGTRRLVKKP